MTTPGDMAAPGAVSAPEGASKNSRMTKAQARARLAAAGIAPRGLSLDEAAAYVHLSPATFTAEVEAGTFPRALRLGASRRQVWDRAALDAALDRASGLEAIETGTDPIMARIRAAAVASR